MPRLCYDKQKKDGGVLLRHSLHPLPMALPIRSGVAPLRCSLSYGDANIVIISDMLYYKRDFFKTF